MAAAAAAKPAAVAPAATMGATAAAGAGKVTTPADIKIILLGDSMVGKSKLVERFLMDNYVPQQLSTEALTVFRHTAKRGAAGAEKTHEIEFWDTAGQERFQSMHPSYYHRAHSCILVFDVTRKLTYTHLTDWHKELQNYRKGIPIIVVANKVDVDYKVMSKSFQWATKRELPLVFCSAADGTNVVKMFNDAIDAAIQYKANPPPDFIEDVLRVDDYFQAKEQRAKADAAAAEEAAKRKAKAAADAAEKERQAKAEADKLKADIERAAKMQADLAARADAKAAAGAKKK